MIDPSGMRQDYRRAGLVEGAVDPDPIRQFSAWFDEAIAAGLPEPNAMTLATATPGGVPSARVVLLKGFDDRGFVFYTNYRGRKGREIEANPVAALAFFWAEHERQVRVEGRVARVSPAESDAYYLSRPVGSRLGAWASDQSEVVPGRDALDARLASLDADAARLASARPDHWGGYRVEPATVEFWQGRTNRLHDRLRYTRAADGWAIDRLSP